MSWFGESLPSTAHDEEELGECEEEDEECLALLVSHLKKSISQGSYPGSERHSGSEGGPYRVVEPFEGLPATYKKKHYKPDYPTDLRMSQVCTPKQQRRKSAGITRAHPKAVFYPSESLPYIGESKILAPLEPAKLDGAGLPLGLSDLEPSPLAQNRMQIPILSTSDEVVVDWYCQLTLAFSS